jgi:hypothetical protein
LIKQISGSLQQMIRCPGSFCSSFPPGLELAFKIEQIGWKGVFILYLR